MNYLKFNQLIFIALPGKIIKIYLNIISTLFFKKHHRTAQGMFFQYLDSRLKLFSNKDGMNYDCRTAVGEKRSYRYKEKSQDLVNWIDDNLKENDILYDIGANIGIYSLYAAKKGAVVYSFEPESLNYSILNRNIKLNESKNIFAYNLAVSNKDEFTTLSLSRFEAGYSNHQLFSHENRKNIFNQGILTLGIDTIINKLKLPTPTHIKIDVDGVEHLIIESMENLFNQKTLKGIAIEINIQDNFEYKKENNEIFKILEKHNYKMEKSTRYMDKVPIDYPGAVDGYSRTNYFFSLNS